MTRLLLVCVSLLGCLVPVEPPPEPVIASVSPDVAHPGATITITGSNLDPVIHQDLGKPEGITVDDRYVPLQLFQSVASLEGGVLEAVVLDDLCDGSYPIDIVLPSGTRLWRADAVRIAGAQQD